MATLNCSWSNFDTIMPIMEDPFALDIPPLDFCRFSGDRDGLLLDWELGVPSIDLDAKLGISSFMDMESLSLPPLPTDPDLLYSLDTDHDQQVPFLLQDDSNAYGSVWNNVVNMGSVNVEQKQQPLLQSEGKAKRSRSDERSDSNSKLTKKDLSRYFYMPITRAAKELNMGLTLLKKCCRQLGIRRWPHRKLMSLKTLMKNVQEGSESEEKKREWIGRLEEERRLIEEMPDLQMHDKTKRLRQSCFKENYKKRRRTNMDSSSSDNNVHVVRDYNEEDDEEELRCLLYCDSLSPLTDIIGSST